ncbi:hypothetical protein [Kordia sp.]|uniref:hypothetical protein n=1 Tax=Kordia sp. TaxID=1965332 RepID=UPI0025C55411|nr:hypothetical protein [Kordia sp.]MCH2195434.1 hypothetical protein [Kordia sp.]
MKLFSFSKGILFFSLLILVASTSFVQTQNTPKFPKNAKLGDRYVRCMTLDGKQGDSEKVIKEPSKKDILKIQERLQFSKYEVIATVKYDIQTQKHLNCLIKEMALKTLPWKKY